MPLALNLAFWQNMGVAGLWAGFTIASIVLDIGFYIIIQTANLERIVYETACRM